MPIQEILFPTDFSEPSYEALKTANELASHFSAELILIHVVSTTPLIPASPGLTGSHLPKVIEEMKDTAQKSLEGMVREKVDGETKSRTMVIKGNLPDEIARVATDEKVNLLVIAAHGPLLGSVPETGYPGHTADRGSILRFERFYHCWP